MSRKIFSLFILAGAVFTSAMIQGGCVPTDPYQLVDPYESDPTNAATNNNDFSRASKITLTNDSAAIDAVLTLGDVDVYDLGDFKIGDQLSVDTTIPDRVLLNASVAVFDSVGRLFYLTSEGSDIASKPLTDVKFPAFAPQFNFIVRQATSPLYLAIASQAEPVAGSQTDYTGRTGGPYTINVQARRWKTGDPLPQTSPQIVALQFDNSTVDYPPNSYFGQISDLTAAPLAGLNGQVLDPAWWRPFIIMQIEMVVNQNNLLFWQNFLTFAGAVNQGFVGQTTPQQAYNNLVNEIFPAMDLATSNPAAFTAFSPASAQWIWFNANGFPWLYLFGLYLGPGSVAGGNPVAGLNVWDTVLPGTYPTTLDPKYDDVTVVANQIKTRMQQDYAGLNVDFRVVGTDPIPTDVPVSTIYFVSNTNSVVAPGVLGLASTIDMGNNDHADFAVIWAGEAGSGNAWLLATSDPDALTTMAQSLSYTGAVGSHELGHILGLVHTEYGADDLMSYGSQQKMLVSKFTNTPLWDQMFPIGSQDGYLSLLLELGMAPTP